MNRTYNRTHLMAAILINNVCVVNLTEICFP